MGAVEVAIERSQDGFERLVALKRLLPEGARDPRHKEMFLREARLAALLVHPNVVHAFAFGELYGELFLAMEYVEGESLSRVLSAARSASRSLDPALVAYVLAEACDGLHAAHQLRDANGRLLNVVHRDVSPQNVMIAYDGQVKILDFGVAKFDTSGTFPETRTGEVKGKMAYMSPEQALGERLDCRSDLFAVGAVLFECMTGRRMWGTGTDVEMMRKLALEEPPRLDEALPSAPSALVGLQARLVARQVAERPASAREAAARLREYAESSPSADAAALRELMAQLFPGQAEMRRTQLNDALRRAAPASVEALRRTLDRKAALERPTLTEPVIVGTTREGDREEGSPGARKRVLNPVRMVAGALALLAVVAVAMKRGSEPVAAQTTMATPVMPTSTPTPTSTSTSTSTPTSTSTSTSTSTPTPTSTSTSTSTSTPTPTPRLIRPAKPSPSPKLPDVDPTPF